MKNEIMKNDATNNTITTIEIAEMMEVSHKSILRKIDGSKDRRGILDILNNGKDQTNNYFIQSSYKDNSGKNNKCYLCTLNGVKILLDNFRNYKNKLYLLKWYENTTNRNDEIILYERKEVEFINALEKVLSKMKIEGIRQYPVLTYRIDYYIPSLKLAIEYDENNHKGYSYDRQELRQEKIENELGCKFVRLSDDDDNYCNIGLVIKEILKILKEAA